MNEIVVFTHSDCLLKDNGSNHPERKERLEIIIKSIKEISSVDTVIKEAPLANIEVINLEWPDDKKEEKVIDCINKAYSIMIDDTLIKSDFIFYEYSKLGVPMQTFFMLIPTNNLDNGKHVLEVYETFKRDISIDLSDDVVGLQVVSDAENNWIIPLRIRT